MIIMEEKWFSVFDCCGQEFFYTHRKFGVRRVGPTMTVDDVWPWLLTVTETDVSNCFEFTLQRGKLKRIKDYT